MRDQDIETTTEAEPKTKGTRNSFQAGVVAAAKTKRGCEHSLLVSSTGLRFTCGGAVDRNQAKEKTSEETSEGTSERTSEETSEENK